MFSTDQLRVLAQMLEDAGFTVRQNPPPMLLDLIREYLSPRGEVWHAESSNYLIGPESMTQDECRALCAKLDKAVPNSSGDFLRLALLGALDESNKWVGGYIVVGSAYEALRPYLT
jgi:hypothetical protein